MTTKFDSDDAISTYFKDTISQHERYSKMIPIKKYTRILKELQKNFATAKASSAKIEHAATLSTSSAIVITAAATSVEQADIYSPADPDYAIRYDYFSCALKIISG